MLPPRYRGLLEVQMDICTGCKRCERSCPIEVIAIDLTKDPATKKPMMARFDIDMGKCMFCGLCVEVCNKEATGAIRHTREFEGAASTLDAWFSASSPRGSRPLYKAPKDTSEIIVGEYGPHAREARERAMRDNPAALDELRELYAAQKAQKAPEAVADSSPVPDPAPAKLALVEAFCARASGLGGALERWSWGGTLAPLCLPIALRFRSRYSPRSPWVRRGSSRSRRTSSIRRVALLGCFLGIAGLYVQLSADFLAAVQVLVYVGRDADAHSLRGDAHQPHRGHPQPPTRPWGAG